MADLSITSSQVVATSDATKITEGKSGAAITIGQSVYYDTSTTSWKLAQADGTAAEAECKGIAVSEATAANQRVSVQQGGTITLGAAASMTAGAAYYLSETAGGIAPEADITASSYLTFMGIANGSDQLVMPSGGPVASGVAHA